MIYYLNINSRFTPKQKKYFKTKTQAENYLVNYLERFFPFTIFQDHIKLFNSLFDSYQLLEIDENLFPNYKKYFTENFLQLTLEEQEEFSMYKTAFNTYFTPPLTE